ncbi:MAG: hypothetical protein CMK59_15010 [Proteobacteria bacterium]|nr:hypothetical protein [Pseudomonadota bacterium]
MNLAFLIASIVLSVLPLTCFLFIVWWLDRFDREPVWLVGVSFGWGAIGAVLIAVILSLIMLVPFTLILGDSAAGAVGAMFIAPLVEEPAKALILLLIMHSRHFDNTTDGFVYGAACGLGFAMTENFMYFLDAASSGDATMFFTTVAIRTFYSATMHAGASSIIGASLGYIKYTRTLFKWLLPPCAVALAMGMHSLWNSLLTLEGLVNNFTEGTLVGLNLVLFPLELLFLFSIFGFCIIQEGRLIRRELQDEVPQTHIKHLSGYFRRFQSGWFPSKIKKEEYLKLTTLLAFRKHQSRQYPSDTLNKEIDDIRKKISQVLS